MFVTVLGPEPAADGGDGSYLCHRDCRFQVLGFEDIGIKLEASVKTGVDGVKLKLDEAALPCWKVY